MDNETVRVFPVADHPEALWLQWDADVNADHVAPAFRRLTAALDEATIPVNVLVDLRQNPALPLTITIQETMTGPFLHRMMGQWLVIGTNWRAQVVANVITKTGIRKNIHWFETEEEALTFLTEVEDGMANPAQVAAA